MLAGLASRDAALGEPELLYLATVHGRAWPHCVGLGRKPGASATYLLRGWPWLRESRALPGRLHGGPYGIPLVRLQSPVQRPPADLEVAGDGGDRLAAGLPGAGDGQDVVS